VGTGSADDAAVVASPCGEVPRIMVTGVSAGLPGKGGCFEGSLERLCRGESCIAPISRETAQALLEKNVVQVKKLPNGEVLKLPVEELTDTIQLAGQLDMSLVQLTQYGVSASVAKAMDPATRVAVVAGLEAVKAAGLCSSEGGWKLPETMQESTGVIFATSFPAFESAIAEVCRFFKSREGKQRKGEAASTILEQLRHRLGGDGTEENPVADMTKEAVLQHVAEALQKTHEGEDSSEEYVFDSKYLLKVLVLANAQLAQIIGAKGPNIQTSAACAGTTQGLAMAQDLLHAGRAERVIVIAGDTASSDVLLPWIGNGFRAFGAACTEADVKNAALPFDKRRNGILLGSGAVGIVLEAEEAMLHRQGRHSASGRNAGLSSPSPCVGGGNAGLSSPSPCRLLATQCSNSAFHGVALDKGHIAQELDRFLTRVERDHAVTRADIAKHGVYLSHETCTHASPTSSCAYSEISALRQAFGEDLMRSLLILNTKGCTGHAMGASFEDAIATEVLRTGVAPQIPNWEQPDEHLGELNLCKGGLLSPAPKYALRFAAGFGSQVAFALFSKGNSLEGSPDFEVL